MVSEATPGNTRLGIIAFTNSILHAHDGTAVYVNRHIEPATFERGEFGKEIERLSVKYGEHARVMRMPAVAGLDRTAIIAQWGKIELQPLNAEALSLLASGKDVTQGLLVDYLGNFAQSAKLGLPVYRISGGGGYLWTANADQKGRGSLRLLTSDASAFEPPLVKLPAIPGLVQIDPARVSPPRDAGKLNAAQTEIDDLKALEVKRQAAIAAAREALAGVSPPFISQRLGPDGLAIVSRLDSLLTQLSNLAEIPLFDRPDYSNALRSIENTLTQISGIQQTARASNDFAENVRSLNSRIDARGRRFLDPDAGSTIKAFSDEVTIMSGKMLPFSEADQRQLSNDMKGLASFETQVTGMMDAQERRYLTADFPMRQGSWQFNFAVDSLTDAQSVNAMTIVDSDETRYQIEVSCKANEQSLLIRTFQIKGDVGKPMPWNISAGARGIRLRINKDPVLDVLLLSNGYSNAGTVFGVLSLVGLVNSDDFIIGDVFPGDQVTVATGFPAQFKRLCVIMDTRAMASHNQPTSPSLPGLKASVLKKDILGFTIGMTGSELIRLGCQSTIGAATYYHAPGDTIRNRYSCPRTSEGYYEIQMTEVLDTEIVKRIAYHFARKVTLEEEFNSIKAQFGGDCVSAQNELKCGLGDDLMLEFRPEGSDRGTLTLLGTKIEEADRKAIAEKVRSMNRPTKF
jgi:hypothetical protein